MYWRRFIGAKLHTIDHVQITALSRALETSVRIAYLDGRNANGHVDFVDFSQTNAGDEPLVLLYRCVRWMNKVLQSINVELHVLSRPGHYDILVKN